MGNLKGFEGGFHNSKIVSRKVLSDNTGNLNVDKPGNNSTAGIGLKAPGPAAINPTSDSDDHPRAKGLSPTYGTGNSGGASGDGATPGYNGSGEGQTTLNGAQKKV